MARTHGRKGRPWERLSRDVIGMWISQGKPCPRCGQAIDPIGTWPARHAQSPSVDHIVPLSVDRSRAHDPANLRVLHYGCNAARGNGTRDSIKRAW